MRECDYRPDSNNTNNTHALALYIYLADFLSNKAIRVTVYNQQQYSEEINHLF